MTSRFRILLSLLLATTVSSTWHGQSLAASGDSQYILDLSGAEVGFTIDVLGLFRVNGRFDRVQGGLLFSGTCRAESIAFVIHTDSVNTNNRLRDNIIRGPSLLNSEDYPVIAFTSTRIVSTHGRPELITGELDMNGKSHPVSFRIEKPHPVETALFRADGYRAIASISRADFGIPSPLPGTSDTVHIRVSLTLREETLRLASSATREIAP